MMLAADRPIEQLARTVGCPQCGVQAWQWCRVLDSWGKPIKRVSEYSHTGRLKKAQARR